jgi:hypothetical protein
MSLLLGADSLDLSGSAVIGFFPTRAELVVAVVLGGWLAVRALRSGVRQPSGDSWWVLALTPLVLALRLLVAPHGTYYENHHGYGYLEAIVAGKADCHHGIPTSYFAALHPLVVALGSVDGVVFVTNALFSAACVAMLAFLGDRLSPYRHAGRWAALL